MGKIKGWTKRLNSNNQQEWLGDDGDSVQVIYRPSKTMKHWITGASGMLHVKESFSRKEATDYAIKYMRSHPRG